MADSRIDVRAPRRESERNRTSRIVCVAGALVLAFTTGPGRADEPDADSVAYARQLAAGVCGTCHGPRGNSSQPKFPRLAAQQANYLVAQLKAFRAQTRGDPDALGYMWGMAGQLDDATIDALANYYASQKPEPSVRREPAFVAKGKEIYLHGIASKGVPACASCHGPDAHGTADFPRLAGQHAQYVLKQLGSFQSNMRNVAVMHGVALNLRLTDMEEVAKYLESQP